MIFQFSHYNLYQKNSFVESPPLVEHWLDATGFIAMQTYDGFGLRRSGVDVGFRVSHSLFTLFN